jgi:hypothetical protein
VDRIRGVARWTSRIVSAVWPSVTLAAAVTPRI